MEILAIILIPILALLTIFAWILIFQSRNYSEKSEHIELKLNGIKINWPQLLFLGISSLLVYLNSDHFNMDSWNEILLILLVGFLVLELGKLFLQIKVNKDRLILNKGEIILVADWKTKLHTSSIKELSLNGFTKKLKLKANKSISFSITRLDEENMTKLFEYLDNEVGIDKLKVSSNLEKLIKY